MVIRNDTDLPTLEQVRDALDYDPLTGIFVRKWRNSICLNVNIRDSGKIAGSITSKGYISIRIDGVRCLAHRLAWLLSYGDWPRDDLDHINCVRTDNRISNLRVATKQNNACNASKRSDNTSGCKGVSWHKSSKKWIASISFEGKIRHLGLYKSKDDARAAYCKAAEELHGNFARTA